ALAAKIDREASVVRVNSLANAVRWDDNNNQLQINGFRTRGEVVVTNAATGTFVGVSRVDDDDDNRNLVLNNLATVPCSIRVQVGSQVQVIPVQNAPSLCVGIAATPAGVFHVDKAEWKTLSNKLVVKGNGAAPRDLVSVFDAITGQLVGTDQANTFGQWKIKARNLLAAPCAITVVSGNQSIQLGVTNAPAACGLVPAATPTVPSVGSGFNQAPEGAIVGPISDMVISVGSSVNFLGTGFDPDSNSTLNYYWNFDGAAADSVQQNPSVVFSAAGVYRVTLTVTDSLGMSDPTPATRVIVVQPNILNNQVPSGEITSPLNNIEVNYGDPVYFSATGSDPEGTVLRYVWNFAGGASNVVNATPGNVYFTAPGVYIVSMTVIDAAGMADPTPEMVVVTVRGSSTPVPTPAPTPAPGTPPVPNVPTNVAPDGQIINPATDMTVNVGDTFAFMATAFDPDSILGGMTYLWNFGGLAPASTQLNPPPITFNTPGVYVVTFTATDAQGLSDPTPSTRTITVGSGANNPGGTGQGPNALITFPSTNQTISVGQSVTFSGSGFDPGNPNGVLSYQWNFGGGATASNQQNPGPVVFNQPGTFVVSLTVRNAAGVQDLTPDTRIITVQGNGNNTPGSNVNNNAPDSEITSPASDLIINIGDGVDFSGIGTDVENDIPLIYSWTFDGALPDMLVQNPGRQVFNQAGSYRVRLAVSDVNGNVDQTPAVRMITVRDPSSFNTEPNGTITSPPASTTVNLGEFVNFTSFGSDPDGSGILSYEWDFGGAAPASNLQNPASVQFNKAGIYKVTLYVKDAQGYYDTTPDVRFITVQGVTNVNQAPEASITSPATDLEINLGDTVNFVGAGQDPDGFGTGLTYMWSFGGVIPGSSLPAPGPITFNVPGTYQVSLTVMDSFGAADMTPAIRTIVVRDSAASNTPPIVSITNPVQPLTTVNTGQSLIFSAIGTDANV
ncbi:MAG: PKD domain-containing protein, partial [Gammaproteobacteria bacterium]|nr:PKD domain-containing protein [Gammaproteobacteria bacterium]